MDNNEILRRIQAIFNYDIPKLIAIFALAEHEVTAEQINAWFSEEYVEGSSYVYLEDTEFSIFLNGLITERRGKKEGRQPKPEKYLTNNIILKKLRIAFDLKTEDILDILEIAEMPISKYELSAFFRREDHKNYRNCKNNIFRAFLDGVHKKHNPDIASI